MREKSRKSWLKDALVLAMVHERACISSVLAATQALHSVNLFLGGAMDSLALANGEHAKWELFIMQGYNRFFLFRMLQTKMSILHMTEKEIGKSIM